MSSVREYYETYWSDEGFSPEGPMDPVVWAALKAAVRPGYAVADVGCGDGQTYATWIAAHAERYEGFDVSSGAVEAARARGLSAKTIEDASELGVDDESFDVVVCNEVFEHLFDPLAAAREALRVLRPGGQLICTVPNLGFWRRRTDLIIGRWNPLGDDRSVAEPWRDPHIRFFTATTLEAMLSAAGFAQTTVAGHSGGVLHHLPAVRGLKRRERPSRAYLAAQARLPSLLGWGLVATARRPPDQPLRKAA